jgi:hypothetical protein
MLLLLASLVCGLLGGGGFAVLNLFADCLHLEGGQGPWGEVVWAGARIGLVCGPLGALAMLAIGRMR